MSLLGPLCRQSGRQQTVFSIYTLIFKRLLKIAKKRLHFCIIWLDKCLFPFDVSENLAVKTALPADGADARRNASDY